ncbi:uncharacterized protein BX663DRAFT_498456 [Cokeromyces recurvatus]|uniref:uncharacterized protein n=1 Tax=Cokeromyces recurvatus TaxID=90255 RepID=UPI00221E8A71|nr:uncharacterized protein BX663DRAFT_498456 [Cokeromyces recurvatus]KAI7906002.1 hypothetical protein BX663DRAFT_498456 [Cokeromyces recurvatus]
MTTPNLSDNNLPRSRPSSIRRIHRNKDNTINSATNSRPSSRPSSRPASRPISPTGSYNESNDNEPIIPTAIVIKNIPFSVKKDALLEKFASLDIPTAYAFNYHFDNGVFRGLAFANYRTSEEAENVVNTLNGYEIGGRKLRVEFKKMLPTVNDNNRKKEREMSSNMMSSSQPGSPLQTERKLPVNLDEDVLDLNNPNVLEMYSYLLLFRGDPNATEIALPKTLSAKERRDAHLIADRLGLNHYSEGFGPDRQIIIDKRGSVPAPIVRLQHKSSRGSLRSSPSRERLGNLISSSSTELKRDSFRKSMMSTSVTAAEAENPSSGTFIHPIRQPRGPEPGKNFASRKPVNNDESENLADVLFRQHITQIESLKIK